MGSGADVCCCEPFDEPLILSVENRVGPNKDETVGVAVIPLTKVDKHADDRIIHITLENPCHRRRMGNKGRQMMYFLVGFTLVFCLDGGYHVFDESFYCSSDLPTT